MSNIQKYILSFILGGIFCLILFTRSCNTKPEVTVISKSDTILIVKTDTIIIEKLKYVPKLKETIIFRPSKDDTSILDTLNILSAFFSKNVYIDTIKGSKASAVIKDTISANLIKSRDVKFIFYKNDTIKLIKDSVFIKSEVTKNKLYIGCQIISPTIVATQIGIAPGVYYSSKKVLYGLNYDLTNKNIIFGLYYNLSNINK